MREILFRGKVADEPDEWVFGDLLKPPNKKDYAIWQHGRHDKSKCCGYGQFSIRQDTIGQFTGLTDRNGVKIFEGDIVQINNRDKNCGYIAWDEKQMRFVIRTKLWWMNISAYNHDDYRIIGNIHDAPELLETMTKTELSCSWKQYIIV